VLFRASPWFSIRGGKPTPKSAAHGSARASVFRAFALSCRHKTAAIQPLSTLQLLRVQPMRFLGKSLFVAVLLAAMPALAQSPPARVGRVSLIEGTLAFYQGGDSDWSQANLNLPVASGEWFATDEQSRAGLRIGAVSVGVARDTQFQVADLREKTMQLALPQGRVNLDLRRLRSDDTAEIDLSRGAVWLLEPGIYDIDSGAPEQPIRITVFAGSARFAGGGIDQTVKAGDSLVLVGTDTLSASTETATEDDFSNWCRAHDYHPHRLAAPYHVSPAMTGYEELDSHGHWATAPNYGTVWYPQSVAADWAPYREGHWVWIEPWGWNWVDDEPWGFAPFHYGRWARIEGRWAWVPGEFVPEPVYAPALVAFVSPPPVAALPADAGPVVGWFPLAPGEVYWPTYTRDTVYIRNINITNVNIVTIQNITRVVTHEPLAGPPPEVVHQRFANLASAVIVPARVFATAARVAPAAVAVPAPLLERASITVHPPPVIATPLKGAVAATTKPAGAPPPTLARPGGSRAVSGKAPAGATPVAVATRPAPPNFARLAPAPRMAEPAERTGYPGAAEHGKAPPAGNAARQLAQPAGTPQPSTTIKAGLTEQGKPPVAPGALPLHPGEPAAAPAAHPTTRAPAAPQQPLAKAAHAATPPPVPEHPELRTSPTADKAAEEARRRDAEAAARQHAAQAAAQQRAAQEAAARQQAARAAAQQRAAQEAAARQQAARAAAQQRATPEAAARQQAGQTAAQPRAAQEAAGRQAHPSSRPSCGQPGQPPCPH
jgi:hypothetical protein